LPLTAGSRLGAYEIITALGAGGMGEVYEARDTRLGRHVAIKVLPAALTGSASARARLRKEARAIAALSHPNICTIYDVAEAGDGQAFLVMELLRGETLQQRLTRGPLEPEAAIDVALALADALAVAHAANLIHRDVKPGNVFLTPRGPTLLDFGLAKAPQTTDSDPSADTMTGSALLTDPGSAAGTVAYMSPEQLRAETLDARTDLFSFGLTIYEMTTGRRAFAGPTSAAVAAAILGTVPVPPSHVRTGLPPRLDDIVLKALEKDRALRYQRAVDVGADLQRLKRDAEPVGAPAAATSRALPARAARWRLLLAAAAAAGAIAVAGYASFFRAFALTDKDTIVLADFTNTTGDPVFDDTLRQGLLVELQQSPFLSVIPDGQVQATLTLWAQTYPRGKEPDPRDLMAGLVGKGTGHLERAADLARNAVATSPDVVFGYGNLASTSLLLDRVDDADAALRQAAARNLGSPPFFVYRYDIAFLRDDAAQLDRAIAVARGKRSGERAVAHLEALRLARGGRLQDAEQYSQRAIALALQEGVHESAVTYQAVRGIWESLYGSVSAARQDALAALGASNSRDVVYAAGVGLGLSGDVSGADAAAADLEQRFPEDTFARGTYAPVLRAISALGRQRPADGIEHLRAALPYEISVNGLSDNAYLGGLHSAYVRGQALMALHRYTEAVAEFQKILSHRGLVGPDPVGALARLQLGRAFVFAGDHGKARAAYEDLFAIWQNADAEMPIVKQAKAEYAALR
jgi:tetratricopeptide (TPR) repeat protein